MPNKERICPHHLAWEVGMEVFVVLGLLLACAVLGLVT